MMNSAAAFALEFPISLDLGLVSTYQSTRYEDAPKEELSVQITDVYGVHVNNVNVLESCQGEVGEDFAS